MKFDILGPENAINVFSNVMRISNNEILRSAALEMRCPCEARSSAPTYIHRKVHLIFEKRLLSEGKL